MSREQHTHAQSCSTRWAVHIALCFSASVYKPNQTTVWKSVAARQPEGEHRWREQKQQQQEDITEEDKPSRVRPAWWRAAWQIRFGNQSLLNSRRANIGSSRSSNSSDEEWRGQFCCVFVCRLASVRCFSERRCSCSWPVAVWRCIGSTRGRLCCGRRASCGWCFQSSSVMALQEASEVYLVGMFVDTNVLLLHLAKL